MKQSRQGKAFTTEAWMAGVGLANLLAHSLALLFPASTSVLMSSSLAAGVGVAAASATPRSRWPALFLVLFLTGAIGNVVGGRPWLDCLGLMASSLIETAGSAWMILRLGGGRPSFHRIREVLALAAAAIVVPGATALLGEGAASLLGSRAPSVSWATRGASSGLGILSLTPALVAWTFADGPSDRHERGARQIVELALFGLVWCSVGALAFRFPGSSVHDFIQPYHMLALLVWPAMRMGLRETSLALLVLSGLVLTSQDVVAGTLPWGSGDWAHRLFLAQLYLGVVTLVGLLLTAAHLERRAAFAAALHDCQQIRAVEDNLPNAMVFRAVRSADGNTRFIHLSAGVETLHGQSADAVLEDSRRAHDHLAAEERERVAAAEAESAGSLGTLDVVARFLGSDGRSHWTRRLAQPHATSDGGIAWDGIETDITDLKLAEIALRERDEQLAKVFQHAPLLFLVTDRGTGAITDVNEEILRMLGYSREEAMGKTATHLGWISPDQYSRLVRAIDNDQARATALEVILRTKDGGQRFGLVNVERIQLGSRDCMLMVGTDITERKHSIARLTMSEQRFRKLFENSPIGIVVVGRKQQIILTNQRYRDLVGLGEAEIIERGLAGLIHPDSLPTSLAMAAKVHSGEIPHAHFEECHVRADGVPIPFETQLTAVRDANGELLYSICWLLDITERKRSETERGRLQEQLAHAQKMESVGRLAGGVAHDFNNMLGVILGNAELAIAGMDPSHPSHASLQTIREAAQQSARLTKQLLAFARRESIAPKVLDLNLAVPNLLAMLQRLVGENIKLDWRPGDGLWAIKMDSSQIDQILANLCVNARDAIADVGTVTISTKNIVVGSKEAAAFVESRLGEFVQLTVSDDGCGMDSATLKRIFEPYFTTKGAGKGTGLGLATVYGAVRQNRGFIHVESTPGKGTSFAILFPRDLGSQDEQTKQREPQRRTSGGETVLLVEDDAELLSLAAKLIEGQGYRVLTASSPAEAIRLARLHREDIRLLLTDVVMPEMNGAALAAAVRDIVPSAKTLFMSGYTADILAEHLVTERDVIAKPFSAAELGQRIRQALGRQ